MNIRHWNIRTLILTLLAVVCGALTCAAQPPENPPEDYVTASIVVTTPGDAIYSCTGHAFFRMQCPSYDMDFCFSYESEPMDNRVLTFLGGGLKMGMAVVPTADFIADYRNEGRGVTEYTLNLPIRVKQNLWRVLDNRVEEGMDLPYDYMERGCAISVLHILEEALGAERMTTPVWPEIFDGTRREILSSQLDHAPWTRMAINILTNGSANHDVVYREKAITPATLVELLQNSRVAGQPVISSVPHELAHATVEHKAGWFTPMIFALIILALTIGSAMAGRRWMLWALVGLQTLLGLLNVYLVFFSSLCATEWSWLLIPFNPLPIVLWKWRRVWELPYTVVIGVWILAMTFASHSLTDPALVVLALSTGVAFAADRLIPDGVKVRISPATINRNSHIITKSKTTQL